jgi:hypothetical protein
VDLTQRTALGAGVAAMVPGQRQEFLIGTAPGGGPVQFGHSPEQAYIQLPWFWGIGAGAVQHQKGQQYDQIVAGLQGQPVGDWLKILQQRGPLPPAAAPYRSKLEEMYGLMMVKEPSHAQGAHRRDLVYSAMSIDLMSGPNARSAAQTLGSGGTHPAAFGGAQSGAATITREMQGMPGKAMDARQEQDARTRRTRERETLRLYFEKRKAQLPVLATKPTLKDVEDFVRKMMLDFEAGR